MSSVRMLLLVTLGSETQTFEIDICRVDAELTSENINGTISASGNALNIQALESSLTDRITSEMDNFVHRVENRIQNV